MVTQVEIEAAATALDNYDDGLGIDNATIIAKLVLEAAEKVRPRRKDSTITERSRRFRSKRNGVGWNAP